MEEQEYKIEYDKFMSEYSKGVTSGEDVGIMIAKMVQYYCTLNNRAAKISRLFNGKHSEVVEIVDDNLKPISVAKAKVLIDASEEAEMLSEAKAHLDNVDQIINGLKYLQKGLINEFQHMGGM